ncbi:Sec-independent protein translocase TatA [Gordonibacter sp. An230]|uniref:twin-arginine translocase TatA/TatE family subunit n=1 Tax=Gordonibacter sp. An230 TaxID=1965592 RepID=UPI000B38D526|nr:twin-arginine translocase TatA/TatE family subunit [Gordonibacter sp. An230]OUO86082.1 Sec-independent protein translocase TatA [Gordonibacter sp. An230]
MKILGMGMPELLIILAVALLIFGPKNLPKLGASLGKTVKGLREGMSSDESEKDAENVELAVEDEDGSAEEPARPAPKKKATVKVAKKAEQTA